MGSALNSFYNDIASLERPVDEHRPIPSPQLISVEPLAVAPTIPEGIDKLTAAYTEKRKKKVFSAFDVSINLLLFFLVSRFF